MTVYELSRGVRYEGSSVVAIYASLERAIRGAWEEAEKQSNIYPEDEWTIKSEKKCAFYLANTMDEYIFDKEREVIE
jgi:hypothetical protein